MNDFYIIASTLVAIIKISQFLYAQAVKWYKKICDSAYRKGYNKGFRDGYDAASGTV